MTPLTPKSGEQEDHIAPRDAVAKKLSTVSGIFGKYAATLIFFLISFFFKNSINLLTF